MIHLRANSHYFIWWHYHQLQLREENNIKKQLLCKGILYLILIKMRFYKAHNIPNKDDVSAKKVVYSIGMIFCLSFMIDICRQKKRRPIHVCLISVFLWCHQVAYLNISSFNIKVNDMSPCIIKNVILLKLDNKKKIKMTLYFLLVLCA